MDEEYVPVHSLDLKEAASCIPIHALPNPDTEPAAAAAWTQNISATLQAALKAVFSLFQRLDERDVGFRAKSTINALKKLGGEMMSSAWAEEPGMGDAWGSAQRGVNLRAGPRGLLGIRCGSFARSWSGRRLWCIPWQSRLAGRRRRWSRKANSRWKKFASITGGRMYRSGGWGEALKQAKGGGHANYEIGYYAEPLKTDGKKRHKLPGDLRAQGSAALDDTGILCDVADRTDRRRRSATGNPAGRAHPVRTRRRLGSHASFSPELGSRGKSGFFSRCI